MFSNQAVAQFAMECDAGDLVKFLDGFERKTADKMLQRAIGAGATKGAQLVRKETPTGPTGNLRRAIGRVRLKGDISGGKVNYLFGAIKKKAKNKASAAHFHLVTGGTKARRRTFIGGKFKNYNRVGRTNVGTGVMPSNPFVVRTAEQGRMQIASAIHNQAAKDLASGRFA